MGLTFSRKEGSPTYAKNKNVLITGASCGIGAELAKNFAIQNANLALVARNKATLQSVADECVELGAAKVQIFPECDLTNDELIKSTMSSVVSYFDSKVDVIVLNAGRSMGCYFEEIQSTEAVNYMLKLNINGVINSLLHVLPSIPKTQDSRIVLISSVSGLMGVPYRTIYCASKHALNGFANALRIELKDTYMDNAPIVQIINFPEVSGTNLNSGRMDMGSLLPPVEFKVEGVKSMMSVQTACRNLLVEIERGTEEWGHTIKFSIVLLLRFFWTTLADSLILKSVKKSHFRPSVDAKVDGESEAKKGQ